MGFCSAEQNAKPAPTQRSARNAATQPDRAGQPDSQVQYFSIESFIYICNDLIRSAHLLLKCFSRTPDQSRSTRASALDASTGRKSCLHPPGNGAMGPIPPQQFANKKARKLSFETINSYLLLGIAFTYIQQQTAFSAINGKQCQQRSFKSRITI